MGKSNNQVTGYKYLANFLLFIGNPIEKLLNINFDKRGWIANERIPFGKNGEMIYIEKPNLYGENEGGVAGTMRVKHGTNSQTISTQYKKYMTSQGLPASAYPYQSYIMFGGGGFPQGSWDLSEEDLEAVGDDLEENDPYYSRGAFYLGNSGYMKEMLLWPQRIHVRNDGREQWYDDKAEIPDFIIPANLPAWADFYNSSFTAKYRLANGTTVSGGGLVKNGFGLNFGDNLDSGIAFGAEVTFNVGGHIYCYFATQTNNIQVEIPPEITVSKTFRYNQNQVIGPDRFQTFCYLEIASESGFTVDVSSLTSGGFSRALITSGFSSEPFAESVPPQGLDINPIHKIREILTDDTAMNKPESDVNNINFMKAADRIYDEGLGVSWAITEKSCLDAINELCGHIEAGVRVNRQTGLYEMVLFRDDWFTDGEIHSLAVSKIKSMSLEVANADEAINQLNVSYYNRDAIKDSSFSVAENASIRNLNGRVNAEDADFLYFMNQRNAAVVAQWKLKQMSSPVWSGSFTTAAYEARKWNRYDLLKLAWPRKWQGTITVRIMKINLGIGTDVSIDFVEVVPYSSNLSSNIVIDTPIDVAPLPPQACQYEPFELPYYLAVMALGQRQVDDELAYENNYGLVGVVAEKPQNNSLYAVMMTHDGVEGSEWLRAATIDYEPAAQLDQSIFKTSTSFTVKNTNALANVTAGTLIKCGSDWVGAVGEWMVFQSIDLDASVVTVKRGALDSLPQAWGVNTRLYFCGNDVAYDQTEYVSGEEVLVAALTATPSGLQELNGTIAIEMKARAFRPYPPANVKINGEYWPAEIETDLIITWVDRNRLQQTGGEILGWYEGGVTIEPGVTTHLTLIQFDENEVELETVSINVSAASTYSYPVSALEVDTSTIQIELKTVRDGYECLQPFKHTVELSQFFSAPYNLTVEYRND